MAHLEEFVVLLYDCAALCIKTLPDFFFFFHSFHGLDVDLRHNESMNSDLSWVFEYCHLKWLTRYSNNWTRSCKVFLVGLFLDKLNSSVLLLFSNYGHVTNVPDVACFSVSSRMKLCSVNIHTRLRYQRVSLHPNTRLLKNNNRFHVNDSGTFQTHFCFALWVVRVKSVSMCLLVIGVYKSSFLGFTEERWCFSHSS